MARAPGPDYGAEVVQIEEEHVGVQNRRFALKLDDGCRIEAVLYREHTLCVSSQVGCAVACPFCASGADGLTRALTKEELIGQVEAVKDAGYDVTRVTVSGIGEPLHNAESVEAFIRWCRSKGIKPSLTTSGGQVLHLARFLNDVPHNGLTISVNPNIFCIIKYNFLFDDTIIKFIERFLINGKNMIAIL